MLIPISHISLVNGKSLGKWSFLSEPVEMTILTRSGWRLAGKDWGSDHGVDPGHQRYRLFLKMCSSVHCAMWQHFPAGSWSGRAVAAAPPPSTSATAWGRAPWGPTSSWRTTRRRITQQPGSSDRYNLLLGTIWNKDKNQNILADLGRVDKYNT